MTKLITLGTVSAATKFLPFNLPDFEDGGEARKFVGAPYIDCSVIPQGEPLSDPNGCREKQEG